jgi:hypothetical protein
MQTPEAEHATLYRSPVPPGRVSERQLAPPSAVITTAPAPDGVTPTAQQSEVVGHDTSSRKRYLRPPGSF